jgi:prephenate dehydratase
MNTSTQVRAGNGGGLARISRIHTLGPSGTNLEKAAHHWFAGRSAVGSVVLHAEVEDGLDAMRFDGTEAILACAVYPRLHDLVFHNLHRLEMVDSFLLDTYEMVLASRDTQSPVNTVVSHPAPSCLVAGRGDLSLTSSNSRAAALCAAGEYDACVTTAPAARNEGLHVVEDFGAVPMVFTLHVGKGRYAAGSRS